MSYPERTPDSRGTLNNSITGTNPFLGGENPPAYQPVAGTAYQPPAGTGYQPTQPTWQPNQYNRGPAQPAQPAPPAPQGYAAGPYGYGPYRPPAATNTLAQIALVAAFLASIVGVVLGHVALSQVKRSGENGRGLAIAALAVGYVQLVPFIGFVILVIVFAGQSS